MASGGEPEIVVNELLCFITNKMLTLPMQMIVQLCVNFYDDDIILSAKTQLHELRPCENTTRVIRRKGPNRKESSVEDIYKFLDELGENVPTFVAHDLAALPPITFENIDLCTLLRAVQNSRDELAIITQTLSEQSVVNKDLSARLFDVERGFVDGTSRTPENVPPFISPPRVERPATRVAPPTPRSALMPLPPDDDSETADSESDSSETAIKTADVPLAATPDDVVSEETPPPLTEGWSAVVRKQNLASVRNLHPRMRCLLLRPPRQITHIHTRLASIWQPGRLVEQASTSHRDNDSPAFSSPASQQT